MGFPVGRVQFLFMYPLTFLEFLQAIESEPAINALGIIPLPDFTFSKLLELFHKYTLIGGMPEIVAQYSRTKDVVSLKPFYQALLTSFQDDMSKYARNK